MIDPFDDLLTWAEVGFVHDSDSSLMMHFYDKQIDCRYVSRDGRGNNYQ